MKDDFRNLLKLLDDENEQAASQAMAELLQENDPRLSRVLRSLQETGNEKLRRRIHQMQSAIIKRRARKLLAENLKENQLSLLEGIIRLHLLWFDNDTRAEVMRQWKEFLGESANHAHGSLPQLLTYVGQKFICSGFAKDELNADNLCLGTILEDGYAMDFMCCIIAKLLAESWHFPCDIVCTEPDFALLSENMLYFPLRQWEAIPNFNFSIRKWSVGELLSLLASSLFVCAVSTDSFRYIYTLGNCIFNEEKDLLLSLPYPYGNDR